MHFQLEPPSGIKKKKKFFLIINKITDGKSSVYLGNCIATQDPRFMGQVDDKDVVVY